MDVRRGELLYKGKAKSLYVTSDSNVLISEFRDDTSAFDGAKKAQLANKGAINHQISTFIFKLLEENGVSTHYLDTINDTQMLVRHLTMFPLESVIRFRSAGSLCRRLGIEQGRVLNSPLFELFYKNDELHDPLVTKYHAKLFEWANEQEIFEIEAISLQVAAILADLFDRCGMILVDIKLEFGTDCDGNIRLGDEISPDSCRIWDKTTLEPLDKDRYRQDLGLVVESYEDIARRILSN